MTTAIPTTRLPNGANIPVLGQGTWKMGENRARRADEIAALRLGLDLGMTLIDTAEMYASGGAEEIVREAIEGRRDEVYLVSKVMPSNASRPGTIRACEASLRRLGTDRIDLYLLHWPSRTPIAETVDAFETLHAGGKIAAWGVSNFDSDEMDELAGVANGKNVQANQVLYNLQSRGIEHDLLPEATGIPLMAYSPVGQGSLTHHAKLDVVAKRHGATAAQVALAWVLRHEGVIAIPKATGLDHIRDNRAAVDIKLSPDELAELDRAFPPPRGKQRLEMI